MKKLILLIFTALIFFSCTKEYKMIYIRDGKLETNIIEAKNDIDAYDKAYLELRAMEKTVEMLKERGVESSLGEVPSRFSIIDNNGKQVFIDFKKQDSLYNKWHIIKQPKL